MLFLVVTMALHSKICLQQVKIILHCFLFLYLRQARLTHGVIMSSTCPLICLLPNLWTQYFENEWINFWCNLCFHGQGHETINFRGQEVKGQGHTRPKIDLERDLSEDHSHSWPLGSSRFSSLFLVSRVNCAVQLITRYILLCIRNA